MTSSMIEELVGGDVVINGELDLKWKSLGKHHQDISLIA